MASDTTTATVLGERILPAERVVTLGERVRVAVVPFDYPDPVPAADLVVDLRHWRDDPLDQARRAPVRAARQISRDHTALIAHLAGLALLLLSHTGHYARTITLALGDDPGHRHLCVARELARYLRVGGWHSVVQARHTAA